MKNDKDRTEQIFEELRKIAEGKLATPDQKNLPAITSQTDALIHELRVHQIELEMQNEELRQVQVALDASRDHYIELYDFAPIGYLTLDESGIIVEINLTAAKLLGKDRKEIINKRFVKFISDDYKDIWYRHFQLAKQNCEPQGCELPFGEGSESISYYHLNFQCIATESSLRHILITFTDVTARKNAEAKLEEAEALISILFDHAPGGMLIVDNELRLKNINKQNSPEKTHLAPLIGRNLLAILNIAWQENIAQRIVQIIKNTLASGVPDNYDFTETRLDTGQLESYEMKTQRVTLPDSNYGVACYYNNITERTRLELELNQLSNDFNAFLENTSDFVYYRDANHRFRFCSNSLAKSVGRDKWQDLVGKDLVEVFPEDTAKHYLDSDRFILNKGKPLLNKLFTLIDQQGHQGWVSTSKWPLFNEDGKVVGIFGISRDVTEQQQIERDLRWSEELNRKILEAFPAHIAVIDAKGNIMSVNEAWTRFARDNSSIDPQELAIGANYLEVCRRASAMSNDDAALALGGIQAVLSGTSKHFAMEYPCDSPKEKRWFLMFVVPLIQKGIAGAVIAHQNISVRKKTEVALRDSEARYRHLLENQTDLILRHKPDGTILYVNEAFCRYFGKTKVELEGNTWQPVALPEDVPMALEKLNALSPINPVVTIENRIIAAKGEVRWGQFVNKAFFNNDGQLEDILTVGRDITERKNHEETLRIAAAAFEAQESILITDSRRVIQRVNTAFTRITGYSVKEAVGRTPALLRSGLHDKDFYLDILETVKSKGYWHGEIWNKRKNGEIFPVLQTITAVMDEMGQLTHYVGAMVDISAQKQAEKVLLDARKRLEKQVATTQEELDNIKTETANINIALNVLLRQRDSDVHKTQTALLNQFEYTVLPMLKKLKSASNGRYQSLRLINILETNIQQLVDDYGRAADLAIALQKLTPIERQVAVMVRQGRPTKVIAAALNIAPGTVSIHRKNIRKKLNLNGKTDNLQNFLASLADE